MQNDYSIGTIRSDNAWNHYPENVSIHRGLHSAERIGAERGYAQGIDDERRRGREKLSAIVRKLKLRGYPIEHIAEDTGFSADEVSSL